MAYFEWIPDYDIGVGAMNQQHQKLIGLMNELHARSKAGKSAQEVGAVLTELQRYTIEHFRLEEQFMASVKFPGLASHQGMHHNLLSRLERYAEGFTSSGVVSDEFFQFLKFWLSAHIRGIDMKYGQHCATHHKPPVTAGSGAKAH